MTAPSAPAGLARARRSSLAVGVAALLCCGLGWHLDAGLFFRSYLLAFLFWSGIALGCLALSMLHCLVGGAWGLAMRGILRSGSGTLPWVAVLFLPLLLGMDQLYPWARPEAAADPHLVKKALYLNQPFFLARAGVYFLVWLGLAHLFARWSRAEERSGDPRFTQRLRLLSGPGLALYGLTVTFASIDWVMSLDPHWYSTLYGVIFIVGQGLSTLAFGIALLVFLGGPERQGEAGAADILHDLGKLLLAFVMLWAYVSFSQFLIVWSGNLPEEVPWYITRLQGGWQWLGLALIVFHFALPFVLLLAREAKRRLRVLGAIALGVVVLRLVDLFWLVGPDPHAEGLHLHWLLLAAPVGVGGIWMALFLSRLGKPAALGAAVTSR